VCRVTQKFEAWLSQWPDDGRALSNVNAWKSMRSSECRGHPFMMSTRKPGFWPPFTCPHAPTWAWPSPLFSKFLGFWVSVQQILYISSAKISDDFFSLFFNPLNPRGRYSGLFYRCIYPKGRYSSLAIVITRQASIAPKWPKRLMVKFFVWSAFNGYCIVSIHLCSASCSAHQSEALPVQRPREKRAVVRERKEALGSPVSKVEGEGSTKEGRSWFT